MVSVLRPARGSGRPLVLGALTLLFMLGAIGPAHADPAVPTEYESQVTGLEPSTDALTLAVVGGDSFLEIVVMPGHTALIPGYFGEPYLRVDPDGTVYENSRSPSKYVNNDRFGNATVPDIADADADAEWVVVAAGGRWAWHDHRTHWMGTDRPPGVGGSEVQNVFAWEIPMSIDGVETLVTGRLDWHPPASALPSLISGLVSLAVVVGWRRGRVRYLAVIGAAAALIGLVLAFTQWLATPAVARVLPVAAAALIIALTLFLTAARMSERRSATATQLIVVACVILVVYVFGAMDAFTRPLLPSALPDPLERVAMGSVAALTLLAGVLAVVEMVGIATPERGGVPPGG